MKFTLREYQQKAVDSGIEFFRDKKNTKNAVIVIPTGGGKSLVIANIVKELDGNVIVFQPSKELLEQNFSKYISYGGYASIFSASKGQKQTSKVTFATIGSVVTKLDLFQKFDHCIVDECFTGETEILTEQGFVRFDELKIHQKVAQWDNFDISFVHPIRHINKKPESELLNFNIKHGISVPMTPGHNQVFLSAKNKIFKQPISEAKFHGRKIPVSGFYESQEEESLSAIERLYIAYQADGSIHRDYGNYVTISFSLSKKRKILRLHALCIESGMEISEVKQSSPDPLKRRFMVKMPKGTTKKIQNHILFPMCSFKANQIIEECVEWDGSRPKERDSMYYFSSTDKLAVDFYNSVATICGYSCYVSIQKDNRKPSYKDIHRLFMTRGKPVSTCGKMSVSTYEESYNGNVYCVEVPSGAIVVRHKGYTFISGNCHLVSPKDSSMYSKFFSETNVKCLGLTATPIRLKAYNFPERHSKLVMLDRMRPRFFNEYIHITQISELEEMGFFAKTKYLAFDFDRSLLKVNSTGADFTEKSILESFKKQNIYDKIFNCIKSAQNNGHKHVLIFVPSIDDADELTKFNGVEMVSGQTNKKERERIINGFKRGEIKAVANVGVLTTGFDFPELDTIILARPTMSLGLYYQMIGRGVRPFPSKRECLIIDLVGNYNRFGRVEDLNIKNLKGWGIYAGKRLITGTEMALIEGDDYEDEVDLSMPFGKYKGKPLDEVHESDPGYLKWLYENVERKSYNEFIFKFIEEKILS